MHDLAIDPTDFDTEKATRHLSRLNSLAQMMLQEYRAVVKAGPEGHDYQPDLLNAFLHAAHAMTPDQINALTRAANPKAVKDLPDFTNAQSIAGFLRFCFGDSCGHLLQPSLYPAQGVTAESAYSKFRIAQYMTEGLRGVNKTFRMILGENGQHTPTFFHISRYFDAVTREMRGEMEALAALLGIHPEEAGLMRQQTILTKLENGGSDGHVGLAYLKPMDPDAWPAEALYPPMELPKPEPAMR